MELLIALSVGLIIFFLTLVLFGVFQEVAEETYQMEERDEEVQSLFVRLFLPLGRTVGKALSPLFRQEPKETIILDMNRRFDPFEYLYRLTDGWIQRIRTLLIGAGHSDTFDPLEIVGLQFVGAIVGLIIGLYFYSALGYSSLVTSFVFLGFLYPMLTLSEQAKKRKFEMQISLPYVLDLLTLAVEAGIDFTQALQRIVDRSTPNPLINELARMLQQIQLGKSRPQALREFADRTDLEDVRSIVQALIQADELGSPLGPVLRIQAEQLRVKRAQRAEKLAQEAPVKLLFPLIGCIFPTVFLILLGPIAIKAFQQFSGGGP